MAGFSELLQILVSCSVDLLGNGAVRGGKGVFMAGARKIGWASGGSGREGTRFSGHRLAGRSLGQGFGGAGGGGPYDPKREYLSRTMKSSTSRKPQGQPSLHGRPEFQAPDGPLGRYGSKWCKGSGGNQRPSTPGRRPRSNINY